MLTVPTLTLPEDAEPAPDGYCAACGMAADSEATKLYVLLHKQPGACGAVILRPEDPAAVLEAEVLSVLQHRLAYGWTVPTGSRPGMSEAMAARVTARLAALVDNYTDRLAVAW